MSVVCSELKCDILVGGGGMAGICCALAAARNGSKVILCQDRPVLGGNASSEIRMHIVGADCCGLRGEELKVEARESGILEELRLENAVRNPTRSASMHDLILYDKCRNEPNIELYLNTVVVSADVENGMIKSIRCERQSTEDAFKITADVFVDCTGDGRLGVEAGADYRIGREARHEYKESLAKEDSDTHSMGSTILFMARRNDRPVPFVAPIWARKFTLEDLKFRPFGGDEQDMGYEYGYWWAEWGGTLDTIKDNEKIRDELLAIMTGIWDLIKNRSGDKEADFWSLEWFGAIPGKRESRRFIGQVVLKESDLLESRVFDDSIAYGGWPLDMHPPRGIDEPDQRPNNVTELPLLYDIPLRSCVSANIRNLMFAGRNISATHVAFSSLRVMGTASVVGQGVGTAAACAAKNKILPAELSNKKKIINDIQQSLLREDAYLINVKNMDSADKAKQATITASSMQDNGHCRNVISGQTRVVGENCNEFCEINNTHRWISDSGQSLPAWIQFQWQTPIVPRKIILIFDTGLWRPLTLTHSDGYCKKMIWGNGQPETVCDYDIMFRTDNGEWVKAVSVKDNYQRKNLHNFDFEQSVDAIKIIVRKTHGIDVASICEIRVYEQLAYVYFRAWRYNIIRRRIFI